MNWEHNVQFLDLILGSVLIAKLWMSGLYKVYRAFWIFLIADIFGSYVWALSLVAHLPGDYRVIWLLVSLPVWYLSLVVVYSHMKKLLTNLPGLAGLSKKFLNITSIVAVTLGLVSAVIEYGVRGGWNSTNLISSVEVGGATFNRVVSSVALLLFVGTLLFLLWFPVSVPKNMASFTAGLLVYFAFKTALLLASVSGSADFVRVVSLSLTAVSSFCFAFWIVQITPAGETAPSPMHLPRKSVDKERLVRQLQLLDQSLVQAARR